MEHFYKIENYLSKNNFEQAGKEYFKTGIYLLKQQEFRKAYEAIAEGYKHVTCDCKVHWFDDTIDISCFEIKSPDIVPYRLDFLKAFIYFYKTDYQNAEETIDVFLIENPKDALGLYLRGRIATAKEEDKIAFDFYGKAAANSYADTKINYRMAKVLDKEKKYHEALRFYLLALKKNPSSICCLKFFFLLCRKLKLDFHEPASSFCHAYNTMPFFNLRDFTRLNVRIDKRIEQWTGEHLIVELERFVTDLTNFEKELKAVWS